MSSSGASGGGLGTVHAPSISDQIRAIEQKLISYGSGPHTPKQQEEITNLKINCQTLKSRLKQAGQMAGLHNKPQGLPSERIVGRKRLLELVREVDPMEQLDQDVEEMLMQVADDFIETAVSASCQLARHRGSKALEVKDVQLHLERNWNIWLPGYGAEDVKPPKKTHATEAHKQRMALIKKQMKKT